MDLGQNINASVDHARKLFTDFGRLAILIILHIIPIVNLIVIGYYVKNIKETPASDSPPRLEKYGDLWMDGLKVAVAATIYMIVPIILIILGALTLFAPFVLGMYRPGMWIIPAGFGGLLLASGIIIAFAVAIIMAMAIVHMIKSDSFGKVFAAGEIIGIVGRIGWGRYILWLIVMFIFGIIVGAINSIPAIGWLISIIIAPIYGVFTSRSAALMYLDGASRGAAAVTVPAGKKFCMACGAGIPSEATFCPICGKPQ